MYKKSFWIWNMGDYEIFHSNSVNSRRQEFGADFPCFWRLYDPERNVRYFCELTTEADSEFELFVNGMGHITVDDVRYASNIKIPLKKGKHKLKISVTNLTGLPSAFIKGSEASTGEGWYTLDEDMKKIPVGFEKCYDEPDKNPEIFPFEYELVRPVKTEKINGGSLYDFGRELFGFLCIEGTDKNEKIHVSYGESREEAIDTPHSILFEDVCGKNEYELRQRAFRYVFITGTESECVYASYEYLPLEYKGSFECDDEAVNKIWDMCAYTLHLTTREVQLEAIKRDRWTWGGDSYQAYKFSNYLFGDKEIIRRSTIALRGKDPVYEHINTITDYSFYWIIGLDEYLLNYNDIEFIRFIYKRAVSLMDFAVKRVNEDGFITKINEDWIFIDWSDMDKDGALCAEQMLCIAALRTMARLAGRIGADGKEYAALADEMTRKVNEYFWCKEKGAYIDTYESGKNHVTRHANIFAIMYNIADEEQKKQIVERVLLNDEITQITTPYFEGYELDVFGMIGNFDYIENKIKTYWKGMYDLGATTVWEEYDPRLSGKEHYEMYGSKYGKSLCHAWGAAPIYLLGKYFLGVAPDTDGFEAFTVKPHLGQFKYIKGSVPINGGIVRVELSEERLSVFSDKGGGRLVWNGRTYDIKKNEEIEIKTEA